MTNLVGVFKLKTNNKDMEEEEHWKKVKQEVASHLLVLHAAATSTRIGRLKHKFIPVKVEVYTIHKMPYLRREGTETINEVTAKYPHTYDWVQNVQKDWITWGGKGPNKVLTELAKSGLIGYDGRIETATISLKQLDALRAFAAGKEK